MFSLSLSLLSLCSLNQSLLDFLLFQVFSNISHTLPLPASSHYLQCFSSYFYLSKCCLSFPGFASRLDCSVMRHQNTKCFHFYTSVHDICLFICLVALFFTELDNAFTVHYNSMREEPCMFGSFLYVQSSVHWLIKSTLLTNNFFLWNNTEVVLFETLCYSSLLCLFHCWYNLI